MNSWFFIVRLISAYFYRGHSPNNDFFQVRPEFKEIREGKRPKVCILGCMSFAYLHYIEYIFTIFIGFQVSFAEYLEIHEYNNIVTRMLGADSFPYRNVTVDEKVGASAIQ